MKSKLFTNNPTVSKKFADDLDIIADIKITDEILDILPRSIWQYLIAMDSKSESEALEVLRTKCSLPPKKMNAVLGIGAYLLKKMEIEDSIDDIMVDLGTLEVIDKKKLPHIRPFVEALLEEYKNTFNAERLAISTQSSGLKTVKSITHIVDFRPVVSNRIELGEDTTKYKPTISTLVPVAILKLRLSGDDDFVFQMNRKTLMILQNELKAIDKELEEAIAFVGKEKVTLL